MALGVIDTIFDAAKIFVPDVYEDDRGFFKEIYTTRRYLEAGITDTFLQDSVSYSTKNVIRGLHYDVAMSKFVQVLRGRVWDVIVDLREGSRTFRKWQGFHLSEFNHKQLYVPAGFAHGFIALSDDVIFLYKQGHCTIHRANDRSAGTTRPSQSSGRWSANRALISRTRQRRSFSAVVRSRGDARGRTFASQKIAQAGRNAK